MERSFLEVGTEEGDLPDFRRFMRSNSRRVHPIYHSIVSGLSILLVDDEAGVLETAAAGLEAEGFAVTCARDGREAIALLRTRTFNVVVTDILMPERDGLEVLMHVRGMKPRPGIIPISGGGRSLSGAYTLDAAVKLGGREPLAKPFTIEQLVAAVRNVTSGGR